MKAKFKESQIVQVSGTATGYGDLTGRVISVELKELYQEPYYHIRLDYKPGVPVNNVFVAEKFLSERAVKIDNGMNF